MVVRKEHLIAVGFLVALVAAYFATVQTNQKALDAQTERAVATCLRTTERAAYVANGWMQLAMRVEKRGNPGDKTSGRTYRGVSESIAGTLPRSEGVADPMRLIQVNQVTQPNGNIFFELTDESRKLLKEGCKQAYAA